MPSEKPTPEHVDWLVEHRYITQVVSAKLYRLLKENPDKFRGNQSRLLEAQLLIAVSFSLWRAAFLSDKTGIITDTKESAELFLEEMLVNNAITYSQDRRSKDWTFNYYVANARFRLAEYARDYPTAKIGPLVPIGKRTPKIRWEVLQRAFDKAVVDFQARLLKAG